MENEKKLSIDERIKNLNSKESLMQLLIDIKEETVKESKEISLEEIQKSKRR